MGAFYGMQSNRLFLQFEGDGFVITGYLYTTPVGMIGDWLITCEAI